MSGRGILSGASGVMRKRSADRVRQVVSLPPSSKKLKASMSSEVPCQLDDLALEDVKRSLSPLEAIFFEPLSRRFAAIVVIRRLSLHASTPGSCPHNFQLIIRDRKGRELLFLVVRKADAGRLLKTIFGRIYQFQTISIWSYLPLKFACTDLLLTSLLTAAVDAELTDVRRFQLLYTNVHSAVDSLAPWISQISPSLRHLRMDYWTLATNDTEDQQQQQQHQALLTAIGRCDQLRSVDLRNIRLTHHQAWLQLIEAICARPKLSALRVIGDWNQRSETLRALSPSTFTSDFSWLTFWLQEATIADLPSLKQFLARIDTFNFRHGSSGHYPHLPDSSTAHVQTIVASLRSSATAPAEIVVRMPVQHPPPPKELLRWTPQTLNNWLLVAERFRVLIKIFCPAQFLLPTAGQLAAMQDAIYAQNIPRLKYVRVRRHQITIPFFDGGQVQLLME